MASHIKGLSQFIADLRTTTTPDAEKARVQTELANLRRKVANSNLASKSKAGYEYRKVVSKLLYIYVLGYDIDFGRDEVNALLNMPKFAEKQVGYLALSLLLNVRSELEVKIASVVEADLRSPNEVITSMALNYVSTYDFSKFPLTEQLENLVYQLMVSPTSAAAVAKKAALTFLDFYRRDRLRFESEEDWPDRVERIAAIFVSSNSGVALAFVPLLIEVARSNPRSFPMSVTRSCIQKLDEVFESGGHFDGDSNEYVYYDVAAPWLVSKLCQLLTFLPLEQIPEVMEECRSTAASLLAFCADNMDETDIYDNEHGRTPVERQHNSLKGSQQHKNAMALVFFDTLRLTLRLRVEEWDPELLSVALQMVKSLFLAKDPNMRYLALEAVQNFSTPLPQTSNVQRKKSVRVQQLRRKDSRGTSQASSPTSTVSRASVQSSPESDTDLIKVVLNLVKDRDISVRQQALEALYMLVDQHSIELAAAELLDMLVSSDLQIRPQMVSRLAALIERFATSHEWYLDTSISLLVIGGAYASEEVWQRLAQIVVNNPVLQAYAVNRIKEALGDARDIYSTKQSTADLTSEAIVKFSAFILGEFASCYQTSGGDPLDLFVLLQDHIGRASRNTRAVMLTAYIKFAARFPHMRPAVMETLNLYLRVPDVETQQRAGEYLALLQPQNADLLQQLFLEPMPPFSKEATQLLFQQMGETGKADSSRPVIGTTPTGAKIKLATTQQMVEPPLPQPPLPMPPQPLKTSTTGSSARTQHLSSNWEFGFKRMLTNSEAVLYQDAILQIGCKYSFEASRGRIALYIRNVSSFEISSLNLAIHNPMSDETLALQTKLPSITTLAAGRVVESWVFCEARHPFALSPTCRITYWAGSMGEIDIRLPIVLERFMSATSPITFEQFQQRWDQAGPGCEFTKNFKNYSISKAGKSIDNDVEVLEGLQYGLVPPSSSQGPFLGAGIVHTAGGLFGCLAVLQPDKEHEEYRVTVRATQKKLAAVVLANNIAQAYQL